MGLVGCTGKQRVRAQEAAWYNKRISVFNSMGWLVATHACKGGD